MLFMINAIIILSTKNWSRYNIKLLLAITAAIRDSSSEKFSKLSNFLISRIGFEVLATTVVV